MSSWLTNSYLHYLKKHKKGDNVKSFRRYVDHVFNDCPMKEPIYIALWEIHRLNKKLGGLKND